MPPARSFPGSGLVFVPRRSPRNAGGARSPGRRRRGDQRCLVEPLEPRALLAVTVLEPFVEIPVEAEQAGMQLAASGYFRLVEFGTEISGTLVRVDVNQPVGDTAFFLELFDEPGVDRGRTTPATAANFLRYVDAGLFNATIIHRSVPGFVVQGGGFTAPLAPIGEGGFVDDVEAFDPVVNEPGNTNVRGTVAMAKLGGDPDSATSQWFVNLADNSGNLDAQNGGFTVFGRVLGDGMVLVDALADVPTFNYGGAFTNLPLRAAVPPDVILPEQFVVVERVATVHPFAYEVVAGPGLDASIDPATGRLSVVFAPGFVGRSEVVVRASSFAAPDFVTAGSFGETRLAFDRAGELPVVESLTAAAAGPTNTPIVVDASFSVPVSFPSTSGITVANGSVSSVTELAGSDGRSHRITVDPAADGPVIVGLAAGAAVDALGRPSRAAADSVTVLSDRTPPTAVFAPVASPTAVPVESIAITFSEPVTGVTVSAFELRRDGVVVPLDGAVLTGSGAGYVLSGLAAPGAAAGGYTLALGAAGSGIVDAAGNPLAAPVTSAWQLLDDDASVPQATFAPIGTPRGGVDQVRIDFSEPVANLGTGNFTLRFGRRAVPLTGASLAPVSGSGTAYVLSGLAAATARGGSYVLTLDTGYTDLGGNRPAAAVALRWLNVAGRPGAQAEPPETPGPAVTPSIAPLPTVRTTPLQTATVRLSEALESFDPAFVGLTRDGQRVSLRGMNVSGGGTTWLVSSLGRATARPGEYVLTVGATPPVASGHGDSGAKNATNVEKAFMTMAAQIKSRMKSQPINYAAHGGSGNGGMRPLAGIARAVWRHL
jgi:cyclophilin family peptidyl-prolyl cis-trans isomerase